MTIGAQAPETANPIIIAALDMLETGGYERVQLREVARLAKVSLSTIYKQFGAPNRDVGTKEQLVVAALDWWMEEHQLASLLEPEPDESVHDGLMRVFRAIFEPWEQHPRLLEAYYRLNHGALGNQLESHSVAVVEPLARAVLKQADPDLVNDLELILTNIAYGVVARFVDGQLAITEIIPILERTVSRLTETVASGNVVASQ